MPKMMMMMASVPIVEVVARNPWFQVPMCLAPALPTILVCDACAMSPPTLRYPMLCARLSRLFSACLGIPPANHPGTALTSIPTPAIEWCL